MKNKGFLLFASLSEFFSDVLKKNSSGEMDFKLGESYILICSRDIVTDVVRARGGYVTGQNDFQSKYKNVSFVSSLLPTASQMELMTTGMDTFVEDYANRLYGESQMEDIISICDIVVNKNTPVFIICTSMDFRMDFPYILRDFIHDEFGLNGYMMTDLEGKSIDTLYEIGDPDAIRKSISSHVDMVLKQYDKEYFFNTLMDDMEDAYREILNNKDIEDLKQVAKSRNIFISRRDDKERIIKKIIDDITTSK